jgi:hypothetical protein
MLLKMLQLKIEIVEVDVDNPYGISSSSSSALCNGIDEGVGGIGFPCSSRSNKGNVTKSASCFGFGTRVERRVGPKLSLPPME